MTTSPTTGRAPLPRRRGERVRLHPHATVPPREDANLVREWVHAQAAPIAIDLFAGAGGLSLGLEWAGFSVVVGADHDPHALETHAANIEGLAYAGDLADPAEFLALLETWGISQVDLLAGGPPCQPFSKAGQSKLRSLVESGSRPAHDPRADLWTAYVAIVRALRPRAVLMENVPDVASWNEGAVLTGLLSLLQNEGYRVEARVLSARDYGVPQLRPRLFVVGMRDGRSFEWPEPSTERVTLWDAIGDLPTIGPGVTTDPQPYVGATTTAFSEAMRAHMGPSDAELVFDHITRDVRPDDAEAFALMPEGGTYKDLPPRLQRYRTDIFTDKYKRLARDEVSRTITAHLAKDGYWYIHPISDRTLSIREAARLQSFPDWFRFAGTPTHRFRQIGNAVPPLVGKALGDAIRAALEATPSQEPPSGAHDRRDLLTTWHAANCRDYPWRRDADPWRILMAEMCLRRTRADQVMSVYGRLVELAPTPSDLLDNQDEVRTLLMRLGLRWRIDNLVDTAHVLEDVHDGVVPDDPVQLLDLPGVGDYVAQAVACFGFRGRGLLIDTNTTRITSRVFGRERPHRRWQVRLDLLALAGEKGPDAAFNYALLDLGALVCRSRTPICEACPWRHACVTGSRPA